MSETIILQGTRPECGIRSCRIATANLSAFDALALGAMLASDSREVTHLADVSGMLDWSGADEVDLLIVGLPLPRSEADLLAAQRALMLPKARVAFFDLHFHLWRAYEVLKAFPNACYFTRRVDLRAILGGDSQAASEPGSELVTSAESLHARDKHGILKLSAQRLAVLKLLSSGKTVRTAAVELGLAESTVDNHKWRIMSDLRVHNARELQMIVLRSGMQDLYDEGE